MFREKAIALAKEFDKAITSNGGLIESKLFVTELHCTSLETLS